MKKPASKPKTSDKDEMRPEYDFRGAIRGKHYKALDKGYTVEIHEADGSTVVKHYIVAEGAVMLQPDVREYFPDAEAVNQALRSLISLARKVPGKRKAVKKGRHSQRPGSTRSHPIAKA
jgi:hypothetical protein